jgi:uncharacterized membrane protein
LKAAIRNTLRDIVIYFVLCIAVFLMLKMAILYSSFETDVAFLQFKQDYLHIQTWVVAFYVHVFSSVLALMAGLTQFSPYVLRHHRPLHRIVGRIYVIDILIINFPAAMIMAYYANGGLPSKIAFTLLDTLWFLFTLKAFLLARQGNIKAHKEFMIRSYALTFSAITLRTWKIILTNTTDLSPETIYMIDGWLGFVPNLLLAEWIIRRKRKNALSTGGRN